MTAAAEVLLRLLRTRYPHVDRDPRLAPHQHAAVVRVERALEAFGGAVLADEAGLGKSWVAAAVAAEWERRGRAVEVLAPAALVNQWRRLLREWRVAAPVMSHDSLLRERPAHADLIVVDEAHRFRNPSTRRYAALAIRAIGRPLLLVTATPVCNRIGDLLSLLRLYAPDDLLVPEGVFSLRDAFTRKDAAALAVIVRELLVRRDRSVLPDGLRFGTLERSVVRVASTKEGDALRAEVEGLRFPLLGDCALLRAAVMRRLGSSEAALRATLVRQRRFYRRAMELMEDGCRISKRDVLRVFGSEDDDIPYQELMFKPFWFGSAQGNASDRMAVDGELERIEALLARISTDRSPKRDALWRLLAARPEVLPALVYTGAVATARDLVRRCPELIRCGMLTAAASSMHGEPAAAPAVLAAFARGELDLLVSTDLGAEGLNLQAAASVIHYDLPWNPVRIDQRNGRAHRIGQRRAQVRAIIFLPEAARRDAVFETLARKNRSRRRLLGTAAAPALAPQPWEDAAALLPRDGRASWFAGGRGDEALLVVACGGRTILETVRRSPLERVLGSLAGSALEPAPRPAWVGEWEARRRKELAAARVLPERVAGDPRERWIAALERAGRLDPRWRERLARSYPAGVELWIERAAGRGVTPEDIDRCESLLERERREEGDRVVVVGGIGPAP